MEKLESIKYDRETFAVPTKNKLLFFIKLKYNKVLLFGVRSDNQLLGMSQIFDEGYFLECFKDAGAQDFEKSTLENKDLIRQQLQRYID